MERLTQTSQFNGGMIKDLHPLVTPNTVMTDCLNGTLITYNGDEFILQNDMGNYAFQQGSLTPNYVPVGLKEYGGLLYIISYNPIENKAEIGTFPAPQTIFNNIEGNNTNNSLNFIELEDSTYSFYSNINNQPVTLLSKDKDINFYLSPGDEYLLYYKNDKGELEDLLSSSTEKLNWQHLNLYVLTDENKLYRINNYINFRTEQDVETSTDYKPISWEIPGWLAARFEINTPEEFGVYFEQSNVTVNQTSDNKYVVTPTGNLKLKTIWSKETYDNVRLNYIKDNLCFIFHDTSDIKSDINEKTKNVKHYKVKQSEISILEYNDVQSILHATYQKTDVEYNYVTPALKVGDNYIIYDQFTTVISTESQTIDANKITFGEEYFKYYVDQNSTTLYFDFKAAPGINIGYNLYRYAPEAPYEYKKCIIEGVGDEITLNSGVKAYSWNELDYNGVNIVDIPYYSGDYDKNINHFDKEDIYTLEIYFFIKTDSNIVLGDKKEQTLYISELTNYFYAWDDYKEIDAELWASNVSHQLTVTINNFDKILDQIPTDVILIKNIDSNDYTEISTLNIEDTFENDNNIKKYYGDAFVAENKTASKVGSANVRAAQRYTLQEKGKENLFKIILPKNQYKISDVSNEYETGRLWKNLILDKIGNNCYFVDTLNKSHKISIENSSNVDFIDKNVNIYFDIYDEYKLVVTSGSPIKKTVANEIITLNSLSTLKDWNNTYDYSNNIIEIKSFLTYCLWDTIGSNSGSMNIEWRKYTKSAEKWTIQNNKYKNSKNGKIIKLENINDALSTPQLERWCYSNNSIYDKRMISEGDPLSPNSGHLNSGQMRQVTNAINGPMMFAADNRKGKNHKIRATTEYSNYKWWLFGVLIPSDRTDRVWAIFYSFPPANGSGNNDTERDIMQLQSMLLYTAMMAYIRIANTVKNVSFYFYNFSITNNKFNSFKTKSLNVLVKFNYNYNYIQNDTQLSETIDSIKKELNKDDNNIITSRIAISNTFYFSDSNNTEMKLEKFITDINNQFNILRDKFSNVQNLKNKQVYLDESYDEESNEIKLSKLVENLQYKDGRVVMALDNNFNRGELAIEQKNGNWCDIALCNIITCDR